VIFTCKPAKVKLYINTEKKTAMQIRQETGCTAVINGGLYDMDEFKPLCHLKAEGLVYATDPDSYYGFGWNDKDLQLMSSHGYGAVQNFICCCLIVKDGEATDMRYDAAMGGYRSRTAMGVYDDGRVWLYADRSGKTPEQLQRIALKEGLTHAIMLDGGSSTQCSTPTLSVVTARRVHNLICVWAEEEAKETPEEEIQMFKIALGAGHGLNTAGKRCLKTLDKNETREWWLNDRICDYVESYLKDYTGYELLRLDDSDDGKDDVALATRTNKANNWGADFYLSIHHNAGANGTAAGGIEAYSYTSASAASVAWRDALYDELIAQTGLKGNRAKPKATANFYVLKHTKMPAVLLELGYMDSKTDVPIVLTNDYAQKCAKAIVKVLVKRGGLTKKAAEPETDILYKVQVGAFSQKENAEKLKAELASKGYPVYMVRS